jgi:glycosyltransferase involved in cell wall biosynthesis
MGSTTDMQNEHSPLNIALVHDWLNQIGGAEDVLEALVGMFPDAPIYTSMYWKNGMPAAYRDWDIRTTWMDRLPSIYQRHQPYLPLYPLAFGNMNLSAYDLVISNKSGFCHGVHTGDAVHICYCLTPTRYLWDLEGYARREALSESLRIALQPLVAGLRRWDYQAAQRVDHFIAISREVQTRIQYYYGRDSVVIHPPLDTSQFQPALALDDYYLVVSRLVPYRRIDLAVQAFNLLGLPLVVVGDGRHREALEEMAGPTVTFLGRISDEERNDLLARCQAYVVPGTEDFGIAPLQAQAAGRPVIAYGAGGVLDTVVEGKTGIFFRDPTPEALVETIRSFDPSTINPRDCVENAARFDTQVFRQKMNEFIDMTLEQHGGV